MNRLLIVAPILMLLSGGLTACNSTNQPAPSITQQNGKSCAAAIEDFRGIMNNDLQMGHVAEHVYSKVKTELDRASQICAAGKDTEARRSLAATKARYGYP